MDGMNKKTVGIIIRNVNRVFRIVKVLVSYIFGIYSSSKRDKILNK